jgi:hypothetical protein
VAGTFAYEVRNPIASSGPFVYFQLDGVRDCYALVEQPADLDIVMFCRAHINPC